MSNRNAKQLALQMVLSLSLIGCATQSPSVVQVRPVLIPAPSPELMQEPDLNKSYSDIVQQLLLNWQQKLTDWKRRS